MNTFTSDNGSMNNNFLDALTDMANITFTENGAKTLASSGSHCVDLFATIGSLRGQNDADIWNRFFKAYCENPDYAMKILFYARDIRGGLGERDTFRKIISKIAVYNPESVKKNLKYISEFGRWDDLICLLDTPVHKQVIDLIRDQLIADTENIAKGQLDKISLIGKWLPSANTSSSATVMAAKKIYKGLHISEKEYRRMLTLLRKNIHIIENNLREKDYTFDYSKQPSGAMLKYRNAFLKHDEERYRKYLESVEKGEATIHTGTLYPYDIVGKICNAYAGYNNTLTENERKSLDVTWNNLEDFSNGRNALCVVDGSGSMYSGGYYNKKGPSPISVAISLGIYFAEHNKGLFKNHFITFSQNPKLVKVQGPDIVDKVRYCMQYNECANTNIQKVFTLILATALKNHIPQCDMPETVYIISDMEFDQCTDSADLSNFEYAKLLFANHGYTLPNLVFWNVDSRNEQQPVRMDETGTALVSGNSPRIFSMVVNGETDPVKFMESVILSERYEMITA